MVLNKNYQIGGGTGTDLFGLKSQQTTVLWFGLSRRGDCREWTIEKIEIFYLD